MLKDSNTNATRKKKKLKEDADEQHEEVVVMIGNKNDDEEEDEEMMMVQMGRVFSKLPGDIFLDILSRVPIKFLSQCRWVCKSWFKFIHQTRFTELQYAKQIQNTRYFPFIVVANDYKDKGIDEAYSTKGLKRVYEVVGSVNGLICFADDRHMYGKAPYFICNPITGDHIILPLSPKYENEPAKSGFGFSTTTNEFKVIRIQNGKAENFTLGSDSWRMIEAFPYPCCSDLNLFLNGNLHWMTSEYMELFCSRVIVSFNVGTEELDVIQPPLYVKQQRDMFKDLRVLGENLWFIDADSDFQIDVWVMKNYGVATSWVKEYAFERKSNDVDLYWGRNYEIVEWGVVIVLWWADIGLL